MGFVTPIKKIFDFVYQTAFENGLTEYEYDHVFVGEYAGTIVPNPEEVAAYAYWEIDTIAALMESDPRIFTSWFHIAFPKIRAWYSTQPFQ